MKHKPPAIVTARDVAVFKADAKAWNRAYHEANEKHLLLKGKYNRALEAVRLLYHENADYIRLNHLGRVHHNLSMQKARDVLKEQLGD